MKKLTTIVSVAISCVIATLCFNSYATQKPSFDSQQVKQIESIIHDYLVNKPEVLIEASQSLQKKQQSKASQRAKQAITLNAQKLFNNPISPFMGNKDGKITVVEFLDYQCGHCKTMSPVIGEVIKADANVRVVIKGLPIFGESSNFAARAAAAAGKQNSAQFRKFHEAILKQKKGLTNDTVLNLAKETGLDVNKLKVDMEKEDIKNHIKDNFKLAQELGLQGTPAFIVSNNNGTKSEFIPGATTKTKLLDSIKKIKG